MDIPELQDDPSILDDELLYRCIHPSQWYPDGRLNHGAFVTAGHPSVDRACLTTREESLARKPNSKALAQLTARDVRKHTVGVRAKPIVPDNPAHALIIRDLRKRRGEWKRAAKQLRDACAWAIPPPGLQQPYRA